MWEVWLVYEPWKLALVVAPFFIAYFAGIYYLEKWLKKRDARSKTINVEYINSTQLIEVMQK